ncbi:MAG: tetratricopeptide repeat protein [Gammaproteobacteria bacterium]|nr:tetratricopeptide repeat protein [Gammaproteobacteria bacterium]
MDPYTSEAQQIENIKKWWRENGLSVVLGLALGVSGIFGWRYWQGAQAQQSEVASALYADMVAALQDDDAGGAREFADQILVDYDSTSYGVFALMTLARLAVADADLETAEARLRQALAQSKDAALAHVIRLRLARVLISRNEPEQAGAVLDAREQGAFAAAYDELLGDIGVMQGDLETARDAYQRALDTARAAGRDITTVELKLDNIGQL